MFLLDSDTDTAAEPNTVDDFYTCCACGSTIEVDPDDFLCMICMRDDNDDAEPSVTTTSMATTATTDTTTTTTATAAKATDTIYDDWLHWLSVLDGNITKYMGHIMRKCAQGEFMRDITESIGSDTAFIVADYAMKMLPKKFWEQQTDHFGKRGMSMHEASVLMKPATYHLDKESERYVENLVTDDLIVQNFRLVCADGTQDWWHTLGCFEQTLVSLCTQHQHLTTIAFQTDGASNYAATGLLLSMRDMAKRVSATVGRKIEIKFHVLTEAGGGKNIGDRDISYAKAGAKTWVRNGNDLNTPSDYCRALKETATSGSVNGLIKANRIHQPNNPSALANISRFGVMGYDNENGVSVWESYAVGAGKFIKNEILDKLWGADKPAPSVETSGVIVGLENADAGHRIKGATSRAADSSKAAAKQATKESTAAKAKADAEAQRQARLKAQNSKPVFKCEIENCSHPIFLTQKGRDEHQACCTGRKTGALFTLFNRCTVYTV